MLTAEYLHPASGDMTIFCPDFTNDIVIRIEQLPTPDLNHDSFVNSMDFAALAIQWLNTGCYWCDGADLQPDGQIDANDLAVLAQHWLESINYPPSVDAGPDQYIILPDNTVQLDVTVSDDGYPDPPSTVSVLWEMISGPNNVSFADPCAVDTSIIFSAPGKYVLRLTAGDTEFTVSDYVTITVYESGYDPGVIYVFAFGSFQNTWYSGTGGYPLPFALATAPDGTSTAAVQTSDLGWTEIRSTGSINIGDRTFLQFDVYFDTDTAPTSNFYAIHIAVNNDNGWNYKWENTSVCWVDGNQSSMGSKTFSPKTWHSFKLDLTSTVQGGPFPSAPDIGIIRMWVPGPIAMHINKVRFTR